ncbi:TPA: MFS transporter, partial [Candidatus Micrarchaeota archaeon]|nr:MFS transporter [Candidatus Micrarchaeota archaeon]
RLREVGASAALIGLVYMVPSLLEVPVFLALGRRSDRWRDRRPLLLWASGVYAAMFLFISAAEEPGWLFWGYSLLAPLAWAPFVMGAFTLMAELVPPRHWATGQTLLSLWLWGVGGILGPLCGGFLAQRWGLGPLFSGLSVGALLSGAMFIGLPRGNRAP